MYVVTGGGTGIGRAIALALADRGGSVLVAGRRQAPLDEVVRRSEGGITAVACDVSTPDGVRELAARVTEAIDARETAQAGETAEPMETGTMETGTGETAGAPTTETIAGLVHCAGGNPAIGRYRPATLEAEAALLEETVNGNLTSAALTVSALADRMTSGTSIVLFGSIAAERGVGYYGPAKAAVASYAVGLAAAMGPRGIRVNCISPGYIAETEFFGGTMTPARAEQLRDQTALGRTGVPDDAVALTEFLLSAEARHVTGQNIHLNGGAFTTR